ncbi:phosphoribosylglycinamide formyltransferase [Eubacteriaceae bacterium ES2]|nr:phosphoribosylglycinamide formyltransferase [Eubacteriaceae bacterium ES2]
MSLKKIAVLVSGGGTNFQSIIDKIHQQSGEIVLVISNNQRAYGLERGKNAGIKALYLDPSQYPDQEAYDQELINILRKYDVDLVVLAGYMKIVSSVFVKAYENAIINVHPALIPSFCGKGFYGMHVHQAVIEYGVKITGATVHFVNEVADGGPIILQKAINVTDNDTPETIQKKVLVLEHELLPKAIKYFCENRLTISGRTVKLRGEKLINK